MVHLSIPGLKVSSGLLVVLHHFSTPWINYISGSEFIVKFGDTVLFNRQPSLHKMVAGARLMGYFTFRLNVSTTKPYNADLAVMRWICVPEVSDKEEWEGFYVPKQIISPYVHTPVGLFRTQCGLNRITKDGVFLTKTEMMNITCIFSFMGLQSLLRRIHRWGRQLVSLPFQRALTWTWKTRVTTKTFRKWYT